MLVESIAAVISGLAVLASAYYSRRALAYSNRAERLLAKSNQISANVWLDEYLRNLQVWAGEASENVSRAIHALRLDDQSFRDREIFESLYRLSSLIDRGRWFFPNIHDDKHGLNKELAFRGIRQPILDHLVMSYDLIKQFKGTNDDGTITKIVHCQRLFISEVQRVINPRRREPERERILKQFADTYEVEAEPRNSN